MKRYHATLRSAIALLLLSVLSMVATDAMAQSSSLLGNRANRRPLMFREQSWTYTPPTEPKTFKLHDLITVEVDIAQSMASEGEIDRKKKASVAAALSDWILLDGLRKIIPDPQTAGDPKVTAALDNKLKSEGSVETSDMMKTKITCRVVDIRPNGNLILSGRRRIRNNNDSWEFEVLGEIRPEDVLPDNTVPSEKFAILEINKQESGSVRDGYRRGFFLKILDKYQPF